MNKYYIGLSSTFHDPALAIVDKNGNILFAEACERHFQNKRAIGCPTDSVVWIKNIISDYCDLDAEFTIANTWSKKFFNSLNKIYNIGLLKKHPSNFKLNIYNRLFKMMLPFEDMRWVITNQFLSNIQTGKTLERNLRHYFNIHKIQFKSYDHHYTHAVYACSASNFDNALCVVIDGGGEQGSISVYEYNNKYIKLLSTHKGPESLGYYYMLLTKIVGYDPIKGEEWKVMGLAPYGKFNKKIYELFSAIFKVNGCVIQYNCKIKKYYEIREYLLSLTEKRNGSFLKDIAFTGQLYYENIVTELLNNIYIKYNNPNLILTGGCALNSAYNGKILQKTGYKQLFIPSSPGDDGNAIGAALSSFIEENSFKKLKKQNILSPYIGSNISQNDLDHFVKYSRLKHEKLPFNRLCAKTAKYISEGKIIGWMQGKAEFGPRALGNRSILADPRNPNAKNEINKKVKFREEYRPFAPSILHQYANQYFIEYQESPYMERTLQYKLEVVHKIPAVVHIDNSGRLQTVKKEWNERYYTLLKEFYKITGIPVLLNTSFNVMGKPIIHSINDALSVFMTTGLDLLVIEDYIFYKS